MVAAAVAAGRRCLPPASTLCSVCACASSVCLTGTDRLALPILQRKIREDKEISNAIAGGIAGAGLGMRVLRCFRLRLLPAHDAACCCVRHVKVAIMHAAWHASFAM